MSANVVNVPYKIRVLTAETRMIYRYLRSKMVMVRVSNFWIY